MKPIVNLENVTVVYENRIALEDVTFKLEEPAFLTIIGPNGAGKTTLLKTLLGLIKPIKGRVTVLGYNALKDWRKVRRLTGYVPQRERIDSSIPILVKDVVLMGRIPKVNPGFRLMEEDVKKAKEALERVNMEEYWDKPFSHLSGGQQQRVLIARALASEPNLLLLDEPLSGVDATSQEIILETLKGVVKKGVSVIMVTHDVNPVMEITDYLLLLNRKVIGFGKPQEQIKPDKLHTLYGRKVEIIRMGETCYVIGGDAHA
ncbi:MAG: metal ABC transporter ATP-binding protein [Thermoprotei archaeon]|nr:MAG: metal ABC transporter ATP-binding protein [Thermoprotei archaeon]